MGERDVVVGRVEELHVESPKHVRDGEVELDDGEVFADAVAAALAEGREVFGGVGVGVQPAVGVEGRWLFGRCFVS